jgi:hypothetical protein
MDPIMSPDEGFLTPIQRRVVLLFNLTCIVIILELQLRSLWATVWVLVQIGAAWFLSVAVHEVGHAVGAALVRFKVWSIGIWPLRLYRAKDGFWRVGWAALKLAGFVVALPGDGQNIRRREMVAVAAGPGASGLAAIGFWVAMAGTDGPWLSWPAALFGSAALLSLYFGVLGFLPIRSRRFVSDGMRLRMLRQPGPEADRYCGLSLLLAASMAGSPPWEWRSELVDMLAEPADSSPDALNALILKYLYCIHTGRLEEASNALEMGIEKSPKEVRAHLWLEAAWFAARIRGDLVSAHQWLDAASAIPSSHQIPCGFSRPRSAIALLERQWEDVEVHAKETLQQCNRLENPGFVIAMHKETEALLRDSALLRAGQPPAIPERSALV